MKGTLIALYYTDTVDEAEVVAQLAELNAIPGVTVVPMIPADLSDAIG